MEWTVRDGTTSSSSTGGTLVLHLLFDSSSSSSCCIGVGGMVIFIIKYKKILLPPPEEQQQQHCHEKIFSQWVGQYLVSLSAAADGGGTLYITVGKLRAMQTVRLQGASTYQWPVKEGSASYNQIMELYSSGCCRSGGGEPKVLAG